MKPYREKTNLEKMGMPCPFGQLMDAEMEIRKLRKKIREAKLMIKSLTEALELKPTEQMKGE